MVIPGCQVVGDHPEYIQVVRGIGKLCKFSAGRGRKPAATNVSVMS